MEGGTMKKDDMWSLKGQRPWYLVEKERPKAAPEIEYTSLSTLPINNSFEIVVILDTIEVHLEIFHDADRFHPVALGAGSATKNEISIE